LGGWVIFYDILQDGFHTPLSAHQIADLFHAGRLGRNTPCRRAEKKEWRTVDELFPLLKYQSATIGYDSSSEPADLCPKTWALVCAFLVGACAIAAVWYYSGAAASPASDRYQARVTETRWPRSTLPNSAADHFEAVTPQKNEISRSAVATTDPSRSTEEAARVEPAVRQRQADEQQEQQAALAQIQEERARQEQKARGQDTIIPLDQDVMVNVGGIGVSVKVHDNDVTSFDVWINGSHYREVRKQKGITQSGTDETLIYHTGRARLYYVWEISGTLNHCRLRVRED
jgi:hypothetical protein